MAIFSRRSTKTKPLNVQPGVTAVAEGKHVRPPVETSAQAEAWRDDRIMEFGSDLLKLAEKHRTGLLSKQFWSDKIMDWSMKDQDFKVQMFRFVDCFPMLRTSDAIYEHLTDYMNQPGVTPPPVISTAIKAGSMAKGVAAKTISGQIQNMAKTFIAGTDAQSALPNLEKLWKSGIAFSVDLLGEACVSDAEADMYQAKYLDLVGNLPDTVAEWKTNERLETDHLGVVPRTNVSIKISSLSAKSDPIDTEGAIGDLMSRIVPILELARDKGVLINFDMEQFELKDLTLELFMRCCEKVDFHAGLAMQAYLKSGDDDARRIAEWSKRTGRQVTVRLVKGAYWDFETIHAEEQGWPCPVWNTKPETDACFERMTEIFLDSTPRSDDEGGVKLALGSHNARSIAAALDGLDRRGLPRNAIELQMLHGMADDLKGAASEWGLRVREYVPVGEMIPGMAYLVRRLLENTSNESWLMASSTGKLDIRALLKSPHAIVREKGSKADLYLSAAERHELSPAVEGVGDGKPFRTEPLRNFAFKSVRETYARAVEAAKVPGIPINATVQDAEKAISTAEQFFPAWRDTDPRTRAKVLTEAARIMRSRRDELAGVMIKEAGKTWIEADADVCEAIDFCDYYARCAVPMFERKRLGRFIGELDETWYQPRGIAAVISPWNFPLAICCGMTVASLVTGNTVIVKPAEQTPGIAALLAEILYEAGCPKQALHFVYGDGESVGAAIVRDPRVAILAFTGSKAVGLDIIQAAGVTPENQAHVKKVVCEMGGKNAVIIDTSADLDEAVLGVRHSAFAFQGQKCSACSRCIVVDPEGPDGPAMRTFIERFVESSRSLVMGEPTRSGTDVAHVIDTDAATKIRSIIQAAKDEGNDCLLELEVPERLRSDERYIGPTIFAGVKPEHRIAKEEIFGPVVAIMHASSFDEALKIANSHVYKLTGGVFTRKPAHIDKAKREFRVGNLYINRGCTGALVARQPFGGFGMSGVGSKAGGEDYLLQFVEPRACCENTMRRGFAPEL
jgi:RHH-type proline utilization regulon transcriptional repressor/proline dehydrogenase/delta 1-pyrroline-5-carboxylate dehydrogenase